MPIIRTTRLAMLSSVAIVFWTGCGASNPKTQYRPPPQKIPEQIIIKGGNGSSCEEAIIILGANALSGIQAENYLIAKNFQGAKKLSQRLITCNGRPADVITIETKDGRTGAIYFDVSDFIGKLE